MQKIIFDAKIEETIHSQSIVDAKIHQISSVKKLLQDSKKSISEVDVTQFGSLIDSEMEKNMKKVSNRILI